MSNRHPPPQDLDAADAPTRAAAAAPTETLEQALIDPIEPGDGYSFITRASTGNKCLEGDLITYDFLRVNEGVEGEYSTGIHAFYVWEEEDLLQRVFEYVGADLEWQDYTGTNHSPGSMYAGDGLEGHFNDNYFGFPHPEYGTWQPYKYAEHRVLTLATELRVASQVWGPRENPDMIRCSEEYLEGEPGDGADPAQFIAECGDEWLKSEIYGGVLIFSVREQDIPGNGFKEWLDRTLQLETRYNNVGLEVFNEIQDELDARNETMQLHYLVPAAWDDTTISPVLSNATLTPGEAFDLLLNIRGYVRDQLKCRLN